MEKIVRIVCSRKNLRGEAAEELLSNVRMKLIDDDYAVFRKFRGQSSLETYLTIIIQRLALDFLVQRLGRWRASVPAQRLGRVAVQMEILLYRDHLSFEEASQILIHNFGATQSIQELQQMAKQIPARTWPPSQQVDVAEHHEPASREEPFPQLDDRRQKLIQNLEATLGQMISELSNEDRVILKMRFESDLKVPQIAETLQIPAKKIYRRLETLMENFRKKLEKSGIRADDIMENINLITKIIHISHRVENYGGKITE